MRGTFPANTMGAAIEAVSLTVKGGATPAAENVEREQIIFATGKLPVESLRSDITPRDILTVPSCATPLPFRQLWADRRPTPSGLPHHFSTQQAWSRNHLIAVRAVVNPPHQRWPADAPPTRSSRHQGVIVWDDVSGVTTRLDSPDGTVLQCVDGRGHLGHGGNRDVVKTGRGSVRRAHQRSTSRQLPDTFVSGDRDG